MAKITFEMPCEIGDLFFVIFQHERQSWEKDTDYYFIEPARVTDMNFFSNGNILVHAESINTYLHRKYIEIGKDAFSDIYEAEKELLRLRSKGKQKMKTNKNA